jgi:IclR family pca regulon transcriptional regulator
MVTEPTDAASGDFVQSLARGLAVIRAFDADHAALSLSDAARRAGIPRAAARRFLHTLVALEYVRTDGRTFALTPRVLELGFSYLSSLSFAEVVQPHLERLSREVDESVSAAVLDGPDIVYVARVPTRRIMNVAITIGTRFPAYATSMGRVLLSTLSWEEAANVLGMAPMEALTPHTRTDPAVLRAELDRTRAQGWALVDGELDPGLRSIAAPVHGRDGSIAGAVNVSTSTTGRMLDSFLADCLPPLRDAAKAIGHDLQKM